MKTKKQFTNRILSLVLTLVMLLGMLPISVFAAEPEVVKSYHVATLYDDGTLEIFADVSNLAAIPWQNERASIIKVVFKVDTPLYTRLFSDCTNLAEITLPSTVTEIPSFCFNSCPSLASITIPDSVTSIGERAFSGCSVLGSVIFGENSNLQSIGNNAFNQCDALTSITIPDSVMSIGGWAFNSCDTLTSIAIPDSVTSIGERAFSDCKKLSSITFGANSQLQTIGIYAFNQCDALTSIAIPDTVTSIGDGAFYNCDSLASVTIPASVTSIGGAAFYGCGKLTDIYYDGTVESWNSITKGARAIPNGVKINHTGSCVDDDTNHICDLCGKSVGTHADTDKDHICDYGCTVAIGTCEDTDKDHNCDYGCGKVYGIHEDTNTDHTCDYGCSVAIGAHAAATGKHTCDYCGSVMSSCKDDDENHFCDICGAELTHDYSTEWKSDATNHWHECSCGDKTDVTAHTPGASATHTTAQKCTVCDYVITSALGHSYSTDWKSDGTNHWHECSCGEKKDTTAHTGGTATCKDKAVCSACGTVYGELAAHTYENGKCTVCGAGEPNYVPETDSPQTGDNSNIALWNALLFVSSMGLLGTIVYDRKKKHTK